MEYEKKYFSLILDALNNTKVTDKSGKEIDSDKGFEMWADQAYDIREKKGGLIFFCGNNR